MKATFILSLENWKYSIWQEKFSTSFGLALNPCSMENQQLGNIVSEVPPAGLKQEEVILSETIDK